MGDYLEELKALLDLHDAREVAMYGEVMAQPTSELRFEKLAELTIHLVKARTGYAMEDAIRHRNRVNQALDYVSKLIESLAYDEGLFKKVVVEGISSKGAVEIPQRYFGELAANLKNRFQLYHIDHSIPSTIERIPELKTLCVTSNNPELLRDALKETLGALEIYSTIYATDPKPIQMVIKEERKDVGVGDVIFNEQKEREEDRVNDAALDEQREKVKSLEIEILKYRKKYYSLKERMNQKIMSAPRKEVSHEGKSLMDAISLMADALEILVPKTQPHEAFQIILNQMRIEHKIVKRTLGTSRARKRSTLSFDFDALDREISHFAQTIL